MMVHVYELYTVYWKKERERKVWKGIENREVVVIVDVKREPPPEPCHGREWRWIYDGPCKRHLASFTSKLGHGGHYEPMIGWSTSSTALIKRVSNWLLVPFSSLVSHTRIHISFRTLGCIYNTYVEVHSGSHFFKRKLHKIFFENCPAYSNDIAVVLRVANFLLFRDYFFLTLENWVLMINDFFFSSLKNIILSA